MRDFRIKYLRIYIEVENGLSVGAKEKNNSESLFK